MLDTLQKTESPARAANTAVPARRRTRWLLAKGVALAVLVMFSAEVLRLFVGFNFHPVASGKCYRSGQPTPEFLEDTQRTYGIKSIVNLRGDNPDDLWFQQEDAAAKRLGLILYDAGLGGRDQAPEVDFAKFIQAMKDAPEPILIHCANGNDRTGFGAAVYLLMRTDSSMAQARKHLSLRYGHIPVGKTLCLHRYLDSYEDWLAVTGKKHHPDHFYYWGMHVYRQEVLP